MKNQIFDTSSDIDVYSNVNFSKEDFLTTFCKKMDYKEVIEAINSLPDKYKDALHYHLVVDLSVEDTAKLLEQTVSATKKQLVRGKRMLLESLENK